jgi:hypothetical protein
MRVYKIGDILASDKRGIITIIEKITEHLFMCNVFDKEEDRHINRSYTASHLDLYIEHQTYSFYPVKE